ncbi:tetratricopeptide repeat protein [Glycomyces sp. L485]|uniref:tetratricopeptide repeat protein n=1 Tax=Glycomyces sp. L485 TaxID=2909235 RepID=UPI001F4A6D49|nr:tetratricopeptide repeat protein [Glycomyces sp. L485]MCH7230873.1 tetratricopeptide repeat protein [Glycomyces sp. L485]
MSPMAIDDRRLFPYVVKIEAPSFRGSGFLAAPGFVLTCAHVVDGIADGEAVRLSRITPYPQLRGVVRARTPRRAGPDGLWTWPDLAVIELVDEHGRSTDHSSPRLDTASPDPAEPERMRAVVAVRPDPGNPRSEPRLRGVDFAWESLDDRGFWWLTGGQALRGMSGGMLVDAERGTIVGVVNNSRGTSGAVATPLTALRDATLPDAFAELYEAAGASTLAGRADWDGAFTRRLDFDWRDYWAPDTSGAHFVGRREELEKLKVNLDESGGLAVVQSIGGFGGVGKTALAVAFGNHYRERFPGGRVFHDFRSYRGGRSDTASDALGSILKAIGAATPDEVGRLDHRGRADRWQAVASGRRLLMIWDNVDSAEQLDGLTVRGDGCATIVTSRDIIRVEPGVKPLRLDVLDEADAIDMFKAIAGDHPEELVAELMRRDLYVPVLISTHAEEVANEEIALEEIIDDLPDPSTARHTTHADHQSDLFERLEGSYRRLNDDARFAFRVLGAHPGYAPTLGSLAAGMGCDVSEAERRMRRLVKAGLAERHLTDGPRRERELRAYRSHDLIRAYGAHLAELEPPAWDEGEKADERTRTRSALSEYYLRMLIDQGFNDQKAWFSIEADSIRDLALTGTSEVHARLARYTGYRALVFNRYDAADVVFHHGKAIAEQVGDTQRTAHMFWGLGEVARLRGELDSAADRYRKALDNSRTVDDAGGIGNAERGLGEVAQLLRRADQAEEHYSKAMEAYLSIGDRRRAAYVQRGLARVAELQEEYGVAEERFLAALKTSRSLDDQVAVGYAQRGLGDVALAADDPGRAETRYREAIATFESVGDMVGAANGLHGLGRVALARGDMGLARDQFEAALEVYKRFDATVWVERVRADLTVLD